MLTPPTTLPLTPAQAAHSVHVFGLAVLWIVGIMVAAWFLGPRRRRPHKAKVRTVARLRPWKGKDGTVNRELYYASGRWAAKRRRLKRKTGYICKWPGCRVAHHLHAHHMGREVYNHLGDERMDELVWLCSTHHDALHNAWPGERHPPLEVQQEWFGVKVKGRRKVAA